MSEINLQTYMSSAIRRIMAKAYRNVLTNPQEAKTVFRLQVLMNDELQPQALRLAAQSAIKRYPDI